LCLHPSGALKSVWLIFLGGKYEKIGILNQPISAVIAGLGHGDMLVIADAGLPIPPESVRIDLALVQGVPGFLQTVEAVLREMQVDKVIVANETDEQQPAHR